MDRRRDRFAIVGALLLAALPVLGSVRSAHAAAPGDVPELVLVEDLVIGASGSTTGDGLFGQVAGVVVDSRGAVHILDPGFGCVWKFSVGGQLHLRYGAEGEGPGEFRHPQAIAIGPDDRIYVGGRSPLITIFDADGVPLACHRRSPATIGSPVVSLVVDDQGRVDVCSPDVREHVAIFQYDPADFALLAGFGDTYAVGHDVDPRAERTFAGGHLAVAVGGELLYAQTVPPLIRIHGQDGDLRDAIAVRGSDAGPPRVEIVDDRITFHSPDLAATAVLGLSDGSIILAVSERAPDDGRPRLSFQGTVHLDQFDRSGRLLRSTSRDRFVRPLCRDAKDRVYMAESRVVDGYECPVVVRYRIE